MIENSGREFILHSASTLDWNDLSGKRVLDIGCGKGRNSTSTLVELYPKVGKVIAIDIDHHAINFAQDNNKHAKVEYHEADIESRDTLSVWEGQMDVVVSHYCFNCLDDKRMAFENAHRLLKPGGTGAIIFTTRADFYDWGKEMGKMYSEYAHEYNFEPPESHKQNYKAADYQDVLKEIGFTVIKCDDVFHEVPYTDVECRDYLTALFPIQGKLTEAAFERFQKNALEAFLKYSPRSEEGFTILKHRAAQFLVRKPLGKK